MLASEFLPKLHVRTPGPHSRKALGSDRLLSSRPPREGAEAWGHSEGGPVHQGSTASFPPRPRPPCQCSGLQGKRRQTPGAHEPGITGLCAARGGRTLREAIPGRTARTTGGFGVDLNTAPSQRTVKRELGQEAHRGV